MLGPKPASPALTGEWPACFAANTQREEPFGLLSVAKTNDPRFFTCGMSRGETGNASQVRKNRGNVNML